MEATRPLYCSNKKQRLTHSALGVSDVIVRYVDVPG